MAAVVVSSCPELIYSRINSKCLLPQLVDMLVLPMATSKASPIDVLRSCIRTHLHHVSSTSYHVTVMCVIFYSLWMACYNSPLNKMTLLRERFARYFLVISFPTLKSHTP